MITSKLTSPDVEQKVKPEVKKDIDNKNSAVKSSKPARFALDVAFSNLFGSSHTPKSGVKGAF